MHDFSILMVFANRNVCFSVICTKRLLYEISSVSLYKKKPPPPIIICQSNFNNILILPETRLDLRRNTVYTNFFFFSNSLTSNHIIFILVDCVCVKRKLMCMRVWAFTVIYIVSLIISIYYVLWNTISSSVVGESPRAKTTWYPRHLRFHRIDICIKTLKRARTKL